jgi:hypothetical protein
MGVDRPDQRRLPGVVRAEGYDLQAALAVVQTDVIGTVLEHLPLPAEYIRLPWHNLCALDTMDITDTTGTMAASQGVRK